MLDPHIAAALDEFATAMADIRGCIADANAGALNWRPGGDGTNSIAVLAVHSMHSTRSWMSIATGAPLPARDRPSEFIASADDAASLLAFVDAMAAECASLLEHAGNVDWAAQRQTHARPNSGVEEQVTAAWALTHALQHLREHTGHMLLTRQLLPAEHGGASRTA